MITLDQVKEALRVTHDEDDDNLDRLTAAAQTECRRFIGVQVLPDEPDLDQGVVLMVSAGYEADPTEREKYRMAAESLWTPYRDRFVL